MKFITNLFAKRSVSDQSNAAQTPQTVRPDPFGIRNLQDLWNHIAYVQAYAPNDWKTRDFLLPHEQMTLARAFALLRDGVEIAYPENSWASKRAMLNDVLDRALHAYKRGEQSTGAALLYEFQGLIFTDNDVR